MKVMYRYDDVLCGDENSSFVKVRLSTFEVVAVTPCGVQINFYGRKKFINLQARRQYACETKEKAKISFIARKRRQASILGRQLANVNAALAIINDDVLPLNKIPIGYLILDEAVT